MLWAALLLSLLVVQAVVIPRHKDTNQKTLLFIGDGTVVQGDKGSHGFIDILQEELNPTPLSIEGAGSLSFDPQKFTHSKKLDTFLSIYKPNALVLMLFDDKISALVESIAEKKTQPLDVYLVAHTPLTAMKRILEVAISHTRRIDPTIEIVIASPLVFHREEQVAEEVCEIFVGMLKQVSYEYKVGFLDLRYPLRKYFEHHGVIDRIRKWNPAVPSATRGAAYPAIVSGATVQGRLHLNHKGHSIIAHQIVSYFELEDLEKTHALSAAVTGITQEREGDGERGRKGLTVRDRIVSERVQPHLEGTGLSHKHFDTWHKDSITLTRQYHARRTKKRNEAMAAYKKRLEEEMKLNNPELVSRADPNDPRQNKGGPRTASGKNREKRRKKKPASKGDKAMRDEL